MAEGSIRVGVGGWSYEPWRKTFYPRDVPKTRELQYHEPAAHDDRDQQHVLSVAEAGDVCEMARRDPRRFRVRSQSAALLHGPQRARRGRDGHRALHRERRGRARSKLGPISWQFAPTKRYDAAEIEAFIGLLPREIGGRRVRPRARSAASEFHVHRVSRSASSARDRGCVCRLRRVSVLCGRDDRFRLCTADARRRDARSRSFAGGTGCVCEARSHVAAGRRADEIAGVAPPGKKAGPRDVYFFFINGAKERAPAAAMALLSRLRAQDK